MKICSLDIADRQTHFLASICDRAEHQLFTEGDFSATENVLSVEEWRYAVGVSVVDTV